MLTTATRLVALLLVGAARGKRRPQLPLLGLAAVNGVLALQSLLEMPEAFEHAAGEASGAFTEVSSSSPAAWLAHAPGQAGVRAITRSG